MTCAGCNRELVAGGQKMYACRKCAFQFCSKDCYKAYELVHSEVCLSVVRVNDFWEANCVFLQCYATWLRALSNHSWCGAHIESTNDGLVKEPTPLDDESLDLLLLRVYGEPPMRTAKYPYSFNYIMVCGSHHLAYEIDLVQLYVMNIPTGSAHQGLLRPLDFIVTHRDLAKNRAKQYQLANGLIKSFKPITSEVKLSSQKWMCMKIRMPFCDYHDWRTQQPRPTSPSLELERMSL